MCLPANVNVEIPEPEGWYLHLELKARLAMSESAPEPAAVINTPYLLQYGFIQHSAEDVVSESITAIPPEPHHSTSVAEETAQIVFLLGCIAEVSQHTVPIESPVPPFINRIVMGLEPVQRLDDVISHHSYFCPVKLLYPISALATGDEERDHRGQDHAHSFGEKIGDKQQEPEKIDHQIFLAAAAINS